MDATGTGTDCRHLAPLTYPQALKAIQVATVKAIQQRIEVRGHADGEGMCGADALMHKVPRAQ